MWANAPGFDLLERTWLLLHPGSTWWGQIPALVMGIASIPVIFFLARYLRFDRWICLGAAFVVSVSPTCVIYSTRYKEYSADFLLACLLLALGEGARRRPGARRLMVLAAVSIGAFAVSASTLPLLIGVWLVLGICTCVDRAGLRRYLVPAGLTTLGGLLVGEVFYLHLSPYLDRYWRDNFFDYRSVSAFIHSGYFVVLRVYGGLTGGLAGNQLEHLVMFGGMSALLLLGLLGNRAMLMPGLVVGSALIACAIGAIPLGTGRTDEVLYPSLLLLFASGLQRLSRAVVGLSARISWSQWPFRAAGFILIGGLLVSGLGLDNQYPAANVRVLAGEVDHSLRPGDHVVVDAFLRYSWALYEEPQPHIVLGSDWMPGFTVASAQHGVFIAPSFSMEGASAPANWTRNLATYKRIWFVETLAPRLSPLFAALERAGWRPVRVIHATNCEAILLERLP
jgi:hypothetical protein